MFVPTVHGIRFVGDTFTFIGHSRRFFVFLASPTHCCCGVLLFPGVDHYCLGVFTSGIAPYTFSPSFQFCFAAVAACCRARHIAPHLRLSLCGVTSPVYTEPGLILLLDRGTRPPAEPTESPPGGLRRLVPSHCLFVLHPLFRCAAWMFSMEREHDRHALEHIAAIRKGLMCGIW